MAKDYSKKIVGPQKGVQVYVTDRGKVVTEEILKEYAVDSKSKQIEEAKWSIENIINRLTTSGSYLIGCTLM
jgi:hypothetical protein